MLGVDGNHHDNMTSRICKKSTTPIFGPKGLARPSPWPPPKSRTTTIQGGKYDEDITLIQIMHESTTRACARQLNLQVRSYLVNCIFEFMLYA
jgi:hypothetical protein